MEHLKCFLFVVIATAVVRGANVHRGAQNYDKDWSKLICKFRPWLAPCRQGREVLSDRYNGIPPAPLVDVFAQPKREEIVENRDLDEEKDDKRAMNFKPEVKERIVEELKELKRHCRPRPGSPFCTGKRFILLKDEEVRDDDDLASEANSEDISS